jgi:hypothetical protein
MSVKKQFPPFYDGLVWYNLGPYKQLAHFSIQCGTEKTMKDRHWVLYRGRILGRNWDRRNQKPQRNLHVIYTTYLHYSRM